MAELNYHQRLLAIKYKIQITDCNINVCMCAVFIGNVLIVLNENDQFKMLKINNNLLQ